MTFPSSPFPRCVGTAALDEKLAAIHGAGILAALIGRQFPVLRSSPLWRQTWISLRHDGYWFPPLSCGPNAFGDPRKKFADSTRQKNWLLFTSDNCPACLADLQAVELMVYGTAYEMQRWPDDWEHRCWFGRGECVCGNAATFTNLAQWRKDVDHIAHDWFVWGSPVPFETKRIPVRATDDGIEMRIRMYGNVITTGPRWVIDPD